MDLKQLLKRSETSAFYLWLLNNVLWKKIPFNGPHKFKIEKISKNAFTISLPYRTKNLNHIKGIHACALATLCEYISGLTLVSLISEKEYRIILKNISMTYHYQAKKNVEATFSLSPLIIENEILIPLQNTDSVFKEFAVEVYDTDKNHICTGLINWQIKKWSKVKTK